MIYAKYEFDTLPEILQPVENEGEIIKPHSIDNADVVIVGRLVKEEGTYDEEGNEITPPVISDKIAVDIFYHGDPEPSLEEFRVNPKNPKHTIAGMNHLYEPMN